MAKEQLRLFAEPENLRALDRERLSRLAGRFGCCIKDSLADSPDGTSVDLALFEPHDEMPQRLVETLNMIADLSQWREMDTLLALAPSHHTCLMHDNMSPADVAAELWLRCPEVVEQVHAERATQRVRSFSYFQVRPGAEIALRPGRGTDLMALTDMLEAAFVAKKRGRGTRIVTFQRGEAHWFQIWHGDSVKRDRRWDNGQVGEIAYRPARYDLVGYDPTRGELSISARAYWQKHLYRAAFGHFLFEDSEYFPGAAKFTLAPLRNDLRAALNCADVPGLERVVFCLLEVLLNQEENNDHRYRSNNLLRTGLPAIPSDARLTRAVFRMKIRKLPAPRTLDIRPSNVALYKHDEHATCMEEWMQLRGYQARDPNNDDDNDEFETILAVA